MFMLGQNTSVRAYFADASNCGNVSMPTTSVTFKGQSHPPQTEGGMNGLRPVFSAMHSIYLSRKPDAFSAATMTRLKRATLKRQRLK